MRTLIGAAVVAGVLAFAGPAAITSAAAAPHMKAQTAGSSDATDISARRYYRRYHHYGYDPAYNRYQPYPSYYARPYYYRPYPYNAPAPFVFGFGFGPFWWWSYLEGISLTRHGRASSRPSMSLAFRQRTAAGR